MHTILDIEKQYPELTKYLDELPENCSYDQSSEVSETNLVDYHKALQALLHSYRKSNLKRSPQNQEAK